MSKGGEERRGRGEGEDKDNSIALLARAKRSL